MKTIEVSFANRRKEKIDAENISLTDAPGWVVLTTTEGVVEMIAASVIKRLRILPTPAPLELAAPVPTERLTASDQPSMLSLPNRRAVFEQNRHFTPLIRQRV